MKNNSKDTAYCEKFAGNLGYSTLPMNPPPAERKSNVIQFNLTDGCSHASCTFCGMYGKGSYKIKSEQEFEEHVDKVIGEVIGENPLEKAARKLFGTTPKASTPEINRIFIGGGNALSADTDSLNHAVQYALLQMKKATGPIPNRVAVYGNTNDILEKEHSGLKKLRCGGTCGNCSIGKLGGRRGVEVIYWGLESGDSQVLKLAGKGYNRDDAKLALEYLNRSSIRASVMIMPGLGGIAYNQGHIHNTLDVINSGDIQWITFIGLKIGENTPYEKWIEREEKKGANRRLTPKEITEQTADMIEGLEIRTTVGLHGDEIHRFGHNPFSIGSIEVRDNRDARSLSDEIRRKAGLKPKKRKAHW